jgi:hypothetical protein
MMWMPNFKPRAWTRAARGANPAPPAADGNRFSAGTSREYASVARGTKAWYRDESAVGSYHWMSTTTVSHPKGNRRSARYRALASTSSSRTLAP